MILYTNHAILRMIQRGLSHAWVMWALNNGVWSPTYGGRQRVSANYNGYVITVITNAAGDVVITTWWN